MTTAQKRDLVRKALRNVKKAYRMADTQGEMLERELARLISRKTLVGRETIEKALVLYDTYITRVKGVEGYFTVLLEVSSE